MKDAQTVMNQFMENWKKMQEYSDVKLNPIEPNYDEFERAYSEAKKIIDVDVPFRLIEECRVIESDSKPKMLVKKQEKKL